MSTRRKGMTLFELLVVMTIMGIVYSIAIFVVKKEDISTTNITLMTLKKRLLEMEPSGKIEIFCSQGCHECLIKQGKTNNLTKIKLETTGEIINYNLDRFGELYPRNAIISHINGKTEQGCFNYVLNPDGTSSFLLLKEGQNFYLYTPMGGETPFVAQSEEALKEFLHNESIYPLKSDEYYGSL
jgi:prepilin-type N-terminal cleavage/methylation domain-containing protein